MMPALGQYAGTVLAAYGVTLALLAGLVAVSLRRAERLRRALAETEAATGRARNGAEG